jgi:hypothetical protein
MHSNGAKSDVNGEASPPRVLDPELTWNQRPALRERIHPTAAMLPMLPHFIRISFVLFGCKSTRKYIEGRSKKLYSTLLGAHMLHINRFRKLWHRCCHFFFVAGFFFKFDVSHNLFFEFLPCVTKTYFDRLSYGCGFLVSLNYMLTPTCCYNHSLPVLRVDQAMVEELWNVKAYPIKSRLLALVVYEEKKRLHAKTTCLYFYRSFWIDN